MNINSIGLMDSGVGGLSVLKKMLEVLPDENYMYIGDTKRMPYGEKTAEQVKNYTEECVMFLNNKNIKLGIIACNTATCYGLKNLQEKLSIPIIGVVEPACITVISKTKNKKVALCATQGTVNSKYYNNIIKTMDKDIELVGIGCPELVLAIEEGHINDDYVKKIIYGYLKELGGFEFDTLILGCTHFPLVREAFEEVLETMGISAEIVDPALCTANLVKNILRDRNELNEVRQECIKFYTTGKVDEFKKLVEEVTPSSKYYKFYEAKL